MQSTRIKLFDFSKNSIQRNKTGPMTLYQSIKEFFPPSMADEIWFIFSLSTKSVLDHEKFSRKKIISLCGIIKSIHDQYNVRLSKMFIDEFLKETGYDLSISTCEIREAAEYYS